MSMFKIVVFQIQNWRVATSRRPDGENIL